MSLDDSADDVIRTLKRRMPDYYKSVPGSGNHELLEPIAEELSRTNTDISDVQDATSVNDAVSRDALKELGRPVGIAPREDETIDHFRDRIKIEYAIYTSEGTIVDLLETLSEILEIPITDIEYREPAEERVNGTVSVDFPAEAGENTAVTMPELMEFAERLLAASYSLWSPQDPRYYIWLSGTDVGGTARYLTADYSVDATTSTTYHSMSLRPDGIFYGASTGTVGLYEQDFTPLWEISTEGDDDVDAYEDGVAIIKDQAGDSNGFVESYSPSGDLQWREEFTTSGNGPASVARHDGGGVLASDGESTWRLNNGNGSVEWSKPHGGVGHAYQQDVWYVVNTSTIYQYGMAGTQQWSQSLSGYNSVHISVGPGGDLFIAGGDSSNARIERRAYSDGVQVWENSTTDDFYTGCSYRPTREGGVNEVLTTNDGTIHIIDASTGSTINTISGPSATNGDIEAFPSAGGFWSEIWDGL